MGIKIGFSKDPEIRRKQLEFYRTEQQNKEFLMKIIQELNKIEARLNQISQEKMITKKNKDDILTLIKSINGYINKL